MTKCCLVSLGQHRCFPCGDMGDRATGDANLRTHLNPPSPRLDAVFHTGVAVVTRHVAHAHAPNVTVAIANTSGHGSQASIASIGQPETVKDISVAMSLRGVRNSREGTTHAKTTAAARLKVVYRHGYVNMDDERR